MMGQPSAYKRHQKVPQKQRCPFSPRFISKLFNPGILRRKLQILASSTRFHADLQSKFHYDSNLQLWNVKMAQTFEIILVFDTFFFVSLYLFPCFLVNSVVLMRKLQILAVVQDSLLLDLQFNFHYSSAVQFHSFEM